MGGQIHGQTSEEASEKKFTKGKIRKVAPSSRIPTNKGKRNDRNRKSLFGNHPK